MSYREKCLKMLLHNVAQKTSEKKSLEANSTEWFSVVGGLD
jgi:hypothetical protein